MKNKVTSVILNVAALLTASCVLLTGCGRDGTKVIFTTGFDKDEVFRIENVSCSLDEIMVYLTTTQNQYESVYGEEIWQTSLDGVTLEENVKETVLAKIAQIKTMYLLAQDRGITLDEEELGKVEAAASDYFSSLNETEIETMGVKEDTIRKLYTEYAMAEKVYRYIIQDINPEISDDEARTITIQHILFRTYTTNGAGTRVEYSDAVKQQMYEKACMVREMAASGESDFAELASKYSEDSTLTYSFGKGEMDAAFEAAAFALETDEISQVVESESGYHVIKCISTFNREQTDANKLQIVEQRKNEVFGQEYDAFVEGLVRNLNRDLWEKVTLIRDSRVETMDFFEVYDRYFGT